MNIFATFECPIKSARYLDDKRVIKMILESAQLLSTAVIANGGSAIYKSTHIKHPCSLWTKDNRSNYQWLLEHFRALFLEYQFRYQKIHKCSNYFDELSRNIKLFNIKPLGKFVNCTRNKEHGIDFTNMNDVHFAYRLYLKERWKHDKRTAFCKINLYKLYEKF